MTGSFGIELFCRFISLVGLFAGAFIIIRSNLCLSPIEKVICFTRLLLIIVITYLEVLSLDPLS